MEDKIWINEDFDYIWESLLYDNNDTIIATIERGDRFISIDTSGQIKIKDSKGAIYKNGNVPEDLKDKVLAGEDYDDIFDEYEIIDNNWFSINFGYKKDGKTSIIEDLVYEDTPNVKKFLKQSLADAMDWFEENEKEVV